MKIKKRDWKKFIMEDISYHEFLKLTLECIITYRNLKYSMKDMEMREKLDKYIEECINEKG